MNRARTAVLFAVAGSLSIWGCGGALMYGEAEEPSIVFSQPLGQTIPGAPQIPVTVPQGIVSFTFEVPDIPFAGGSKTSQEAGFTIASSMKLNQASLVMPPSTSADFNGLDSVTLVVFPPGSATGITLAQYTKDPAHLPGQTLVLKPVGDVELLDLLTGNGTKALTLSVSGSGTLPANSWTADVELDVRVRATASWP
ncbi:MAG TPA: hypothetical protein VE964_11645 [Myxococcales bacterium]|nr:hypothetical protein [Myxococcales bacterium]